MPDLATAEAADGPAAPYFRLLDLPAELRLCIYEFAVIDPQSTQITALADMDFSRNKGGKRTRATANDRRVLPPITRVSRSIRADTVPMYYKVNTFIASYPLIKAPDHLKAWLEAIGPGNRGHIRRLSVEDVEPEPLHDVCYVNAVGRLHFFHVGGGKWAFRGYENRREARVTATLKILREMGATIEKDPRGDFAFRRWITFPTEKKNE